MQKLTFSVDSASTEVLTFRNMFNVNLQGVTLPRMLADMTFGFEMAEMAATFSSHWCQGCWRT
jgi:hypothetical protein